MSDIMMMIIMVMVVMVLIVMIPVMTVINKMLLLIMTVVM